LYPIISLELAQMTADATELAYGSRKAAHIVTVESLEYWLDQAAQDRWRQFYILHSGAV